MQGFDEHSSVKIYRDDMLRMEKLQEEETKELVRRIRLGDEEARNRLVEGYLHVVYQKAYKLWIENQDVPLEDLIQAGNYRLVKCASGYDGSEQASFRTYLVNSILHGMKDEISKLRHLVKYDSQAAASLDDHFDESMGGSYEIVSEKEEGDDGKAIQGLRGILTEQEIKVLNLYFRVDEEGNIGQERMPYREIAERLGLWAPEVEGIVETALEKIREKKHSGR